MKCSIGPPVWAALSGAIHALRLDTIRLDVSPDRLVVSCQDRGGLLGISLMGAVTDAIPGGVILPARALHALPRGKSVDPVQMESVIGGVRIVLDDCVCNTRIIAGAGPEEVAEDPVWDPTTREEILASLLLGHAGRDVRGKNPDEPAQHSRDEIPFLMLSASAARTVAGLPGGRLVALGPGLSCLGAEPAHIPLTVVSTIRALLGQSHWRDAVVQSYRSDSVWMIQMSGLAGVRILIRISLQPNEMTPFDSVSTTWMEAFETAEIGEWCPLQATDLVAATRHLTGAVSNRDAVLIDLSGSEYPAPVGWPVTRIDPGILSRAHAAAGKPGEMMVAGTDRVCLVRADRFQAIILGSTR